jgi:hypothetical protein
MGGNPTLGGQTRLRRKLTLTPHQHKEARKRLAAGEIPLPQL